LAGLICKEGDFAKVIACSEDRHNGVGEFELGRASRIVLKKVHCKPFEGICGLLKTHVSKCFCENWNNKRFQVFLNFCGRHVRGRGRNVREKYGNFAGGRRNGIGAVARILGAIGAVLGSNTGGIFGFGL